jgi:hypothetical protein
MEKTQSPRRRVKRAGCESGRGWKSSGGAHMKKRMKDEAGRGIQTKRGPAGARKSEYLRPGGHEEFRRNIVNFTCTRAKIVLYLLRIYVP